jgi:hypothetical protein
MLWFYSQAMQALTDLQTKESIENTVGLCQEGLLPWKTIYLSRRSDTAKFKVVGRVNSTVQGTTYQILLNAFKEENLDPRAKVPPYKVVHKETRKVSRDCYISFLGNNILFLKVAGRTAELQIFEGKLEVYVIMRRSCEHEILPGNCRVSRKKEHFQGLLSEILKENSKCKKDLQIPLKSQVLKLKKGLLMSMKHSVKVGFE